MLGGLIKYFMAVIIVIPGIALYSILGDSLGEPDLAFPYLVKTYLPIGIKGIVLCGLFASLMSTIDSTFNSLATLWSIDIYSNYINKTASDQEKIKSGRLAIIFSLVSGLTMGLFLLYLKFDNPDSAFTHTLNNLRYYINCGIVVLICSTIILVKPKEKNILLAFLLTLPINFLFQFLFPEMNYFVRAFWVIFSGISIAILGNIGRFNDMKNIVSSASLKIERLGILLLISLILIHILFH
jgi:SSS family solute:Na+ symporter